MSHSHGSHLTPGDNVPVYRPAHSSVNMETAQKYPTPRGYPASLELFEQEGYIMESLELLATAPISQYYGPAHGWHERDPRSRIASHSPHSDCGPRAPPETVSTPWDKRSSFQQVHHRTVESQEHQQPFFAVSSSSSSQSPGGPVPIYAQFSNYHTPTLPPQPPSSLSHSSSDLQPPPQLEEPSLKRQRNNAASSRFRAKKKRNEEMMLVAARETEEMVRRLEGRVAELETENRWLKDLLIDKSEARTRGDSRVAGEERNGCEHTEGVGTGD